MSDDPARIESVEAAGEAAQAIAQAYIQIIEVETGLVGAAAALEQRDGYGRVPLIARIHAQPPIRIELVIIAIALVASGALVPSLDLFLRVLIWFGAAVVLIGGILSRIFIRVPIGAVGVIMKGGRPGGVLAEGSHIVNPLQWISLTHLVSTRQLAFDVPAVLVRSADGVGVTVDALLTLVVTDAQKLVRSISTGDLDQLVHATSQDAVRKLVRGMNALDTLDLGPEATDRLRAIIDERLESFGLTVPSVAITSVTLPAELTASLEARRLAAVKLAEQVEQTALDQRRITDQARLEAEEQEGRRAAVQKTAEVEELRLAKLEARLAAYPAAARYDLELARLRVAEKAAGNTRAIVSLGGSDVSGNLLIATDPDPGPKPATAGEPGPAPVPGRSRRGTPG